MSNQYYSIKVTSLVCLSVFISHRSFCQTPCSNGFAGEYPCNNVDLVAHMPPQDLLSEFSDGAWVNDIWGWEDPDSGGEYAIIGMPNGTSFVDLSVPTSPVLVGFLPEHGANSLSGWRDLKVYSNHVFIVSEDVDHGMQVFDLSRLKNVDSKPEIFTEDGHYAGVSNAHNIVINEETGFAYIVGANSGTSCNLGGLHIVNIQNPKEPFFAGCFDDDLYTHDAQCVVYNGPDVDYKGREICFNANADKLTIVDVTDKNNPTQVGSSSYSDVKYAHQGWLTEDHSYFISNDEIDEITLGANTRTLIWDMQDLENPKYIDSYYGETKSIDHNLYIDSVFVYQSNYAQGLRILTSEYAFEGKLKEIAYFDTYPSNNETNFEGTWSNYPFFKSGLVIVSDINRGLFVLRPDLSFYVAKDIGQPNLCEQSDTTLSIEARGENLVYQWQMKNGGSFTDLTNEDGFSDVTSSQLTLSNISSNLDDAVLRCKVTNGVSEIIGNEGIISTHSVPDVSIEHAINDLQVTLTSNTKNTESLSWDFGDGNDNSSETNPVHIFDNYGTYDVILRASNLCGTDSATLKLILSPTSSKQSDTDILKVFPIPTTNYLKIAIPSSEFSDPQFNITDTSGKKISRFEQISIKEGFITLNISRLRKGIYYLTLLGDKQVWTAPFIVQ